MTLSAWFRRAHRFLAIFFTTTVVITTVALAMPQPIIWVSYVPLFPLAFLLISGLYLFALPYRAKRRAQRLRSS
jgi:Flp pilus assembly protein TadB